MANPAWPAVASVRGPSQFPPRDSSLLTDTVLGDLSERRALSKLCGDLPNKPIHGRGHFGAARGCVHENGKHIGLP